MTYYTYKIYLVLHIINKTHLETEINIFLTLKFFQCRNRRNKKCFNFNEKKTKQTNLVFLRVIINVLPNTD